MKSASPRFFVDTNILAYAYDTRDARKKVRAEAVLDSLWSSRSGAISTQVLSELFNTMIRPGALNFPRTVAEASVSNYLRSWLVFDVTSSHVLEAMRGVREHQLPYYDSLIWATARLNGVPIVLSEDGQDGRWIEGVRTVNPLTTSFDLHLLD